MQETQNQPELPTQFCPICRATLRGTPVYCPSCGIALSGATGRLATDRLLAGRYQIVRLLARGGMGAVYLAEDRRLAGAPVAVKEMASSFVRGDTEAFARAVVEFQREAAMLARLRHPHLPRVSDQFDEEGKQYLVMEYIEGQTLRETLQLAGGRLALDQALDYANQLCDVLAYLHSQRPPIIYRDLKPSNVMVVSATEWDQRSGDHAAQPHAPSAAPTPTSQLVLIDFGIARFYRAERTSDTAVYGTIGYAPLEQYGQGQTDARTDIYALGVLLHQMLTGHDPSTTPFALPPPRELNPAIPPQVAAAIMRATANDRAERFNDIAAFRSALRAAAAPPTIKVVRDAEQQLDLDARESLSAQLAARSRGRRSPVWVLVAVVGMLLVGLLASAVLRPTPRTSDRDMTAVVQGEVTGGPAVVGPDASAVVATPSAVPALDANGTGATAQASMSGSLLLRPSHASASASAEAGVDASGASITYEPQNAIDGRNDTAWRVAGDGVEQWLQLDFATEVSVQAIGIIPGYDKIDPSDGTDRFAQNRVVKLARFEFSDGTAVRASFTQQRDMQFVATGGVRTRSIRIVIEQTFPPLLQQNARDFTPISEVEVRGTP